MTQTGCPTRSRQGVSLDYVERRVSEMILNTEKNAAIPTPLHSHRSKRAIVKLFMDLLFEIRGVK